MSSNFQRNREADARNAQIAVKTEELKRWLEVNHPDIHSGIGTQKAFLEDMGDAFLTASNEDFEYSLRTMETNISRHRVESEAEIKEELIETICSRIASSDGTGRDGKYDQHSLSKERSKMDHWTIPHLTQRLETILEKQRLQPMSAAQIKHELRASRPAPQPKVLPIEYTKERIHAMPPHEIKRLIRDWTAPVVNDRLFGRS
jgi:hypothetical protein